MKIILFLLMLIPSLATASTYKCTVNGKVVYSDVKCGPDAETVKVRDLNPDRDPESPIRLGQQTCRDEFPAAVLRDPGSAIVARITRGLVSTEEVNGTVQTVYSYHMFINSKNMLGGYTGIQAYRCFVAMDGKRFIGGR